ncbi:MAG: hypothetical protein WBC06_10945 [Chitinophagaceae bacterium]
MAFEFRHILLLLGIVSIILSFLFFGRATKTYDTIILSGLTISIITYLIIIIKDNKRNKILWTLVVFAGISVQLFTEPLLIRCSYLFFLRQNEKEFIKINQVLLSKTRNITWVHDSTLWKRNGLSTEEGMIIKNLVNSNKISLIEKDYATIYYRTFGMLDVSHGIFYFYTPEKPDSRYRHIYGNWYY